MMDSVSLDRSSSLKAHKPLPKKLVDPEALAHVKVASQVEALERRLSQSQAKSQTISSWIPDQSQVLPNPNLPLTPPPLPLDTGDAEPTPEPAENEVEATHTPRPSTPIVQRSPPTPDTTPPRKAKYPEGLALTSLLTPPQPSRNPSSVAESFRTAQEQLPSSEDETPMEIGYPTGRVGLGLGLETPEGSRTPTAQVMTDPFVAVESAAVLDDARTRSLRRKRKGLSGDLPNGHEDFQASLDRDLTLRERVERDKRHSSSPSIDRFADQIHWPSGSDIDEIHVDPKRLSELSTTSQVVQAFVVPSPPQKRGKLRRSSKVPSLRAASSPLSGSNRSSVVSSDARPRLHHRKGRITNCVSLNSDSGISMGSDMRKPNEEMMHTSDIPQRQSSLRTRNPSLLPTVRSLHATSRPTTAPDQPVSRDIVTKPRKRAVSDVAAPKMFEDLRGRSHQRKAPEIPARGSSLSAPTTRNGSRATSLTSTSLHRHNMQQQQSTVLHRDIPSVSISAEPQSIDTEDKPATEEISRDLRQSLLTTPFSNASLHSSTPGPYELTEATAINIYPHSNTSVLVVQQMRDREGERRPRLSASLSGNVRIELDKNGIPRIPPSHRLLDSPLKRPRQPPPVPPVQQTPAVMLIPPTPGTKVWSDAASNSVTRGRRGPATTSSGAFAMVRRALSARRYSESMINPFATLVRRQSVGSRTVGSRPVVTGSEEAKKTKLSPFWRPRGFWDDLSDDSDEEAVVPDNDESYVRNTLGLPQRRVIPGPRRGPSLVRRLGSLKRRQRPTVTHPNEGHLVSSFDDHDDDENDTIGDVEKRVGILSRLKHTKAVAPFASLQEAIEKLRAKRTEERLEKQRERLRRNIGPVVLQNGSQHFYGPEARI